MKKVKFKINVFDLMNDLGGWDYFENYIESTFGYNYIPKNGSFTLLSTLENDELLWETELIDLDEEPMNNEEWKD